MEYTRFGDKIIRRESADYEWEDVPANDLVDAKVAVGIQDAMRDINFDSRGGKVSVITRSDRNIEIAEKLGITADEMADRLARSDHNQGTVNSLLEEEFDDLMKDLNLSPEEARARFKGTFWRD